MYNEQKKLPLVSLLIILKMYNEQKKLPLVSSITMSDPNKPPKTVTVKFDQNKPKITVKKGKPIQPDLDVAKEFQR